MRRLVATLAGLALVGVPATVAMAGTHTASHALRAPAVMRQMVVQGSPAMRFHHGPCHHLPGDINNTSGTPQV